MTNTTSTRAVFPLGFFVGEWYPQDGEVYITMFYIENLHSATPQTNTRSADLLSCKDHTSWLT